MKNIKKAFTLVELMIVISIIGVLAITLLPKLQGAQARSRDAGRIASITSVEAVLNTYFSDEGIFPRNMSDNSKNATDDGNGCLSTSDGTVISGIAGLFKGAKAPVDPHKSNIAATCGNQGAFAYYSLVKDGISDNSYMLIANVEAYQKANYNIDGTNGVPAKDGTTDFTTIKNLINSDGTSVGWGKLKQELTPATNSVYAIIN